MKNKQQNCTTEMLLCQILLASSFGKRCHSVNYVNCGSNCLPQMICRIPQTCLNFIEAFAELPPSSSLSSLGYFFFFFFYDFIWKQMLHELTSNISEFPRIHFSSGKKAISNTVVKCSWSGFGAVLAPSAVFSRFTDQLTYSVVQSCSFCKKCDRVALMSQRAKQMQQWKQVTLFDMFFFLILTRCKIANIIL